MIRTGLSFFLQLLTKYLIVHEGTKRIRKQFTKACVLLFFLSWFLFPSNSLYFLTERPGQTPHAVCEVLLNIRLFRKKKPLVFQYKLYVNSVKVVSAINANECAEIYSLGLL